jgi:tetratricopeptide (TPR) repeat protein
MKRVFCTFALVVLSATCFAATEDSNKIDAAKEQLKHVNTYYWLSRARNNDFIDAEKMLHHATMAKDMLKGLEETAQIKQMKSQADSAISEANAQISATSSAISSFSPVFSSLTGSESVIGRYVDPNEIAIVRCLEGILEVIKKPYNVSQIHLIITADGNNLEAEEIAHGYLNATTSYYAIPGYELLSFLTAFEVDSLNHAPISKEVLDKICRQYSIKSVGILHLFKNDDIDRILYWGADYNYWNIATGKKGYHCSADGFCESPCTNSGLLWLLILLGFPTTLIFNWYKKEFNKNSTGSSAPVWLATLTGGFSFIVVTMTFKGIAAIGIDQDLPITSPMGIGWIAGFTLILGLLPLLLTYIGASRIKQVSAILNNPETVSSIVFGSYLGSLTFLAYTAAVRLEVGQSLLMVAPAVIVAFLISLRLGLVYSKHAISNDKASGIEYIILIVGLVSYMLFVLQWNFRLLLFASGGLLVFCVLAVFVSSGIVKLKMRFLQKIEKAEGEEAKGGLAWLRREIKAPAFFCKPWEKQFADVQKWITHNDDTQIEVVFIEAPMGCGKTRTANEIAKRIVEQYEEKEFRTAILFGDCDEFSEESDLVPYEPFAQALGDLLGVGRFANPAEKADKLRSGLEGMGLKTAMRAAGMGSLETLLDAREDDQAAKTNTKEMANVVAEALTDLSRVKDGKDGRVIFIIDDVQWMDNESFELLKRLFEALKEFKDNQVSFIFTHRPDSRHGHHKVKDFLEELKTNRVVNLNYVINQKLLENEEIVEALLTNLRFDYRAKVSLIEYFREMGIVRPLYILQTLETLIEKSMTESLAEKFVLTKNANLKQLPPPDDFRLMVEEELAGLDPRIISILQCCATIGRSFKTSIISAIFKMDLLELLDSLKESEKRGIVRDVGEEDDTYEFVEKRMVGIFRSLQLSPMADKHIAQDVKEYHKRFVFEKEREIQDRNLDIASAPYRDVLSLASHSFAVRDVYPDKVVLYNRLAAEKTYSRGMFSAANRYYGHCIDIISSEQKKVRPMEKLGLYISYAKCLLDEQSDSEKVFELAEKAHEILKTPNLGKDIDKDLTEIEINLIEVLNYYRNGQFQDAGIKSDGILKNNKASVIQKARAKFYYAASLPPQEAEKRRDMHLEVLEETDKLLETGLSGSEKVEILKVKSEAANSTGFVYLHGLNNPKEAIEYFETAIDLNKMKEINDQKGIAISHTGLGDVYDRLNQPRKAEQMYKVNLDISEKSGELQGICVMNSKLGAIKIKEANSSKGEMRKNLLEEAGKLYEKSLATAEDQRNPANICFALSGMIETIIASEAYGQAGYVCTKLEEIASKLDLSNAPDFAKNSLKDSLSRLAAESPEHENRVREHCDSLSR